MFDAFHRSIHDLRISVTDRCNYRCVYCRSGETANGAPAAVELTWAELRLAASLFVELGIRKIRLTGGEPLLRAGLVDFVAALASLGVEDLALTTNGHLLGQCAESLRRAGLRRVTISLDSVHADKFARITRVKTGFDRVIDSVARAQAAGLDPVKINVVLLRGFNDDEVEAFAAFAREHAVVVRFIEFMPLEEGRVWSPEMVVPLEEIVARVHRLFPLVEIAHEPSETAKRYRFVDGAPGEIGVIAPVTRPFCGHCSRIRLTADGKIRTCLFSLREWDLAPLLRQPASHEAIREFILEAVAHKEERHHIGEPGFRRPSRTMVHIGG
ncbi:MAG: GTP 3',8-cyclase MoaA [Terriglobales bacterium]